MNFPMHVNWTSPAISSFRVVRFCFYLYAYLNRLFSMQIVKTVVRHRVLRRASVLGLQFLSMPFKKDAIMKPTQWHTSIKFHNFCALNTRNFPNFRDVKLRQWQAI